MMEGWPVPAKEAEERCVQEEEEAVEASVVVAVASAALL